MKSSNKTLFFIKYLDYEVKLMYLYAWVASVAELVDATDSKSVACKGVLVRFRPGAPIFVRVVSCHKESY